VSNIACLRPAKRGTVCQPCAKLKKKCVFPNIGPPTSSPKQKFVIGKVDAAVSSVKKVLGGKRKAKEVSPELGGSVSPSPFPSSFDTRPSKKPSTSSLVPPVGSGRNSPTASSGMQPPDSYPSSLYASSVISSADPLLALEVNRLTQQLHASREDLFHERQGREADRFLYEQQLALLKEERNRSAGWKGKERE